MNSKKKYLNLGTMTAAKPKTNDPDEPKRYYIRLEQQKDKKTGKPFGDQIFPITLANGVVLNDGDMLAMFSKKEKFKKQVEDGKMDQEKADFLSSFLLFDIVAVKEESNEGGNDEEIEY
jgi:hypothetical protein